MRGAARISGPTASTGSLDGIFELQDQVANSVAGVIEPTLETAEIRRSADLPTKDVTAYDLYLRGTVNLSHRVG